MSYKEETDRKDLVMRRKGQTGYLRGQEIIAKRNCQNNTKKYSFPQRNIDIWNWLKEEVIIAKNVQ